MKVRKLLVILALMLSATSRVEAQTIDEVYKKAFTEGGTLNFYATLAQVNAASILPAFEKRFPGIKVNHIDATSDQLAARIIAESRGGKIIADIFQTLLDGIATNPDTRISTLPLLTPAERHQLLVDWNATTAEGGDPGARQADGALASYDALRLYYLGFGANGNRSTRLRRYDGTAARPCHGVEVHGVRHGAVGQIPQGNFDRITHPHTIERPRHSPIEGPVHKGRSIGKLPFKLDRLEVDAYRPGLAWTDRRRNLGRVADDIGSRCWIIPYDHRPGRWIVARDRQAGISAVRQLTAGHFERSMHAGFLVPGDRTDIGERAALVDSKLESRGISLPNHIFRGGVEIGEADVMLYALPACQRNPHRVADIGVQRRVDLAIDAAAIADELHLAVIEARDKCILDNLARAAGLAVCARFRESVGAGAGRQQQAEHHGRAQ